MKKYKLVGPITQLISMEGLPIKGAIKDENITILKDAGILIENEQIKSIDTFENLNSKTNPFDTTIVKLYGDYVVTPGFIDAHTHICFSGSRAKDYAMRNAGKSYLEIAENGGGIWDTVLKTRKTTQEELTYNTIKRANELLKNGITTIEVKSGYGLSIIEELKMLRAIKHANETTVADLISTCLAAHILPKDFEGTSLAYLTEISKVLFPILKEEKLSNRIDIFVEKGAFSPSDASNYLKKAKTFGFDLTIHADQFSTGGSKVAVDVEAISADHLEASSSEEIKILAESSVISVALPGASIGLGCSFTPARKILDAGGALAIASDWNPGSAPMGDLLTQACILGTFQKLSNAEILAGITYRAAGALNLTNRGRLLPDMLADFNLFQTTDINEIFYHQGTLRPTQVWKRGNLVYKK